MQKLLIMGMVQSGKTTIINVVIKGADPHKILNKPYEATLSPQREFVKILEDVELAVFDTGGQVSILDEYVKGGDIEIDHLFENVVGLFFILDVADVDKFSQAKYYFQLILERLEKLSPRAHIHFFIHKMDLIKPSVEAEVVKNAKAFFSIETQKRIKFHTTTILDETIYLSFKTALYECVATIFIAQVYGFDLSISAQALIIITALLASIGAASVPMSGLVMMSIILNAVGLPLEGVALILAVDRVLDMFRTTVNVLSDSVGAVVIATLEGEKLEI